MNRKVYILKTFMIRLKKEKRYDKEYISRLYVRERYENGFFVFLSYHRNCKWNGYVLFQNKRERN